MALFRNCLQICNLTDLGYVGPKFTWSNKQDAQCNVRVRLDRGVANVNFSELFSECSVQNVITSSSDHYALHLILTRSPVGVGEGPPVQQGFRYEAAWRRADDYHAVVDATWDCHRVDANPIHLAWTNLNQVAGKLKVWSERLLGPLAVRSNVWNGPCSIYDEILGRGVICRRRSSWSLESELFEREEIMPRAASWWRVACMSSKYNFLPFQG
ncbi:hypothetical protein ZWY2020_052026 [Hordeum vulgare]|nr:hypothetical protein ZWY2020_052026 [Hordeum vulgare]